MTTKYIVAISHEAYKSTNGWMPITAPEDRDAAKQHFGRAVVSVQKKGNKRAVALFNVPEDGSWWDRDPRMVYNIGALNRDNPMTGAISNIINNLDSSWF